LGLVDALEQKTVRNPRRSKEVPRKHLWWRQLRGVLREVGRRRAKAASARKQGLTLLHFSAQRKRYLWDRGCIEGLFRVYFAGVSVVSGGVRGYWGV